MNLSLMMTGLKQVAPLVGAWIEILWTLAKCADDTSRTPRGCVDWNTNCTSANAWRCKSHPSWVRGLKLLWSPILQRLFPVAPLVGAWIEIIYIFIPVLTLKASHPSWVRGLKYLNNSTVFRANRVAPLVGAWIEIRTFSLSISKTWSHPSWVRGLKFYVHKQFLFLT